MATTVLLVISITAIDILFKLISLPLSGPVLFTKGLVNVRVPLTAAALTVKVTVLVYTVQAVFVIAILYVSPLFALPPVTVVAGVVKLVEEAPVTFEKLVLPPGFL